MRPRIDDQFAQIELVGQRSKLRGNLRGAADKGTLVHGIQRDLVGGAEACGSNRVGRLQWAKLAALTFYSPTVAAERMVARLSFSVGRKRPHAKRRFRFGMALARLV